MHVTTVNPILAESVRGDMVENHYRGAFMVINADGDVIKSVGDVNRLIYPRSSLKPMQALSLIESGAATAFKVSDEEIALASASHGGEDHHVKIIDQWLKRLKLTPEVLECGIHPPLHKESAHKLEHQGHKSTPLHNACSGNHLAFITTCLHLKLPIEGYTHFDHPVQQRSFELISQITGFDVMTAPKGIDGCQVPVVGMSLTSLALGMARLSTFERLPPALQLAAQRITNAMKKYPSLIAGTDRFCTRMGTLLNAAVLVKMGAEGVFSGIVPFQGWGLALKIDDGNTTAAEVAMMGLLDSMKLIPEDKYAEFEPLRNPIIKNFNHHPVGYFRFKS